MRTTLAMVSAFFVTLSVIGCTRSDQHRQLPAPQTAFVSRTVFKTVKHPLANIAVLTIDDGNGPYVTQVIDFCPEGETCPVATGKELELLNRIWFARTPGSHKCLAFYDMPSGGHGMLTPNDIDCATVEHLLINK